ncbi:MAG TPA: 4Fe-4S dicluster domain-containing protein [Jiangellales bacterium]|nr:4Fe-4S dicluster domain-containing protein [Jiangellales bacterium]
MPGSATVLDVNGLQSLVDVLRARGYTVLGPTVRDGAVVDAEITGVDDLPRGWGDEQDAGRYRLRRRDDDALFGFAAGAQSAKPVLFPADALLWRGSRTDAGFTVETGDQDEPAGSRPPYALLGVRSCDLHAIGVLDTVLAGRRAVDTHYAHQRRDSFVVAVTCGDPGGTCFCTSMGTGPRPESGYDLALTELLDEDGHRFLVETGSALGAEVLADLPAAPARASDVAAADQVAANAAGRMGRSLETDGLREVLYAAAESPRWNDVASRCLACTNCTLVCPTCFCTSVDDVTDLTGTSTERHRVWDSCFSEDYAYLHGGSVRSSTAARYRQWMTHKLASWIDQFGTSGCVGCGRCITWCPAAIDITAEAAVLRAEQRPADREHQEA